ncbi:MAG: ABC transporter permease [Desulfobacteraceae bacterium]|nr:ABC transporter permease [Desulfobacteraceae bacterium]
MIKSVRPLKILLQWEVLLIALLAVIVTINSVLSPYFLDIYNLFDSTYNFSEKALITLPMALIIICGDIDISVASIIAIASVFMGMASAAGAATGTIICVGLITGCLAGLFNGLIITRFGIPAIVVTIGTMSLFRGIAYLILGDQAYTVYPESFSILGQGALFDLIPYEFIIFLICVCIFGFVLHFTTIGRRIYAIGNNATAAEFAGINTKKYRLCIFAITGLMCGLASILLTSRIGSTRPNIAMGWELEIITVVILGGVNILGGSGKILGVFISVFVIGMVMFGFSLLNVPGIVMSIFIGFMLIVTLMFSNLLNKLLT